MTIREKFKRRVIELIHCVEYEEALRSEIEGTGRKVYDRALKNGWHETPYPINIGRVMKALHNRYNTKELQNLGKSLRYNLVSDGRIGTIGQLITGIHINWELIKENGQECTDHDQSDETIEALYDLIK